MQRSRAIVLTRLATAAAGAALLLAACDGAGGASGDERYPRETGARCATEADSPEDCEAAEEVAEEVETLDGVDRAGYEFRTIDGEGINELILTIAAGDDSTAEEVAAALTLGRELIPSVDGDRDASVVVTRAGATFDGDVDEDVDAAEAADVLIGAGAFADHGFVQVSVAPAEIWVQLTSRTTAAIAPAADAAASAGIPPSVKVILSGGGSYLSGRGLDHDDAARWDAAVAAAGQGDPLIGLSGRDLAVTIDGPRDIRPRDFTFAEYGERYWPMIRAHLDLVRDLGRGASYTLDTNWEQNEAGFDTILRAVVGPADDGPDPRGWDQAAEDYLDG